LSRKREEPVRLTRIYTRTGDDGETSLGDGRRVSKTDALVEAFGSVDELNSTLGVALTAADLPAGLDPLLKDLQNELFDLGADLSVPVDPADKKERLRITEDRVERLEQLCDEFNAELPDLRSFVLPGGTEAAACLHFARTVCRRAERATVIAARQGSFNQLALAYLNRLSDLLFILARAANASAGRDEPLWKPGVS
jgi:cob(I)alamin adenosyltransferase